MPPDLASRIAEHLALVCLAMAIGLGLAIPLGVLAARRPVLARLALAAANGLQTIPSLAPPAGGGGEDLSASSSS